MLTNDDLYSMKRIISEELIKELHPLKADIKELRTDINLIQKDLKPIKGELRKLRKDLTVVISLFDNDITDTRLRVDRIEANLHLPSFVPQAT